MSYPWLCLAVAILFEVVATCSLKASHGFTRLGPSLAAVGGYTLAFYLLSLSLRHVPLGIAYAVWSGVGTATTALIGMVLWNEALALTQVGGIGLILVGVVMLNLVGKP